MDGWVFTKFQKLIKVSYERTYFLYYENDDPNSNKSIIVSNHSPNFYQKHQENLIKNVTPISDWEVPVGYVHNGYFHLFIKNYVIIFSSNFNVYRQNYFIDTPSYQVPTSKFFVCNFQDIDVKPYPSDISNGESYSNSNAFL